LPAVARAGDLERAGRRRCCAGALQAEFLALEGIAPVNTVARIKQRLNPKLHIAGVVLTMADRRMTLSQQVEADVRGHFGELVFGTTIPRNVRIAEAPSHGLPVLIYDNACAGSQAYILLASEFIRRRRLAAEAAQQPASPETSHEPVT
jgi:chromosome partitioning protein